MQYIRLNHVEAEPMAFGEFKEKFPKSGGANIERDPADDGYVITYRKGEPNEYVSWCPKAEFEAVSRPVDGMTFGQAIEAMKQGRKVARRGWNGKGMWLCIQSGSVVNGDVMRNEPAKNYYAGKQCNICAHIDMKASDDSYVVGWLASQTDMLADDWVIVE